MNPSLHNLGFCPDLSKRLNIEFNCCDSCHQDDLLEYAFLGKVEFEDGYYDTCCNMRNRINDKK